MPALPMGMALPPWAPPGSEKKPGVMVVDDEIHVLDSVRSVIEYLLPDTRAWFFADPMDALEAFPQLPVGLLVTDFKMNRMNGFELIDAVRRRRPTVPAFVITAFNDPQVLGLRAEALKAPVLNKPFDAEEFVRLIQKMIQTS